jgi:hypothetical protein
MARRASYSYERSQRDRAKTEKREAKKAARAARKDGTDGEQTPINGTVAESDSAAELALPELAVTAPAATTAEVGESPSDDS